MGRRETQGELHNLSPEKGGRGFPLLQGYYRPAPWRPPDYTAGWMIQGKLP